MENKLLQRSFAKYISLNVLAMMGTSIYILADTFFVANGIGTVGLAALNLAITIFSMIIAISLMLGIGSATRFAIDKARNKTDLLDETFSLAIYTGIMFGIVLVIIGNTLSDRISYLIGANEETIKMTSVYIRTILSLSPVYIINNILIAFVRNDGNPKLATIGVVTGNLANVVLDYVFIYTFDMGMFGAALATGLCPSIGILIMMNHFKEKKNSFRFSRHVGNKIIIKVLEIFKLGSFALVNELATGIVVLVFNLLLVKLGGNSAVAAYGVVANVSIVVVAIFTGISQGMQPLVSENYGKDNTENVKKIFRWAINLSLIVFIITYTLIFVFNDTIIQLFNHDNNQVFANLAKEGLRVYFVGFIFAGVNIITTGYYSSIEMSVKAFFVSMCRGIVVIIPTAIFMSLSLNITGVWLSFSITEAVTLCIILIIKKSRHLNLLNG